MLTENLVNFFKEKKWWYDSEISIYKEALTKLEVDMNSEFIEFYLHVEDLPTFSSNNSEIYQMGWFLVNTDIFTYMFNVNISLGMSLDYIPLDAFEGEGGYFYNKSTGRVVEIQVGVNDNLPIKTWNSFNEFLEYFFDIN